MSPDAVHFQELAARTIRAQDEERARVAKELHESTAQSLAALTYQLAAVARDARDPAISRRLHEIRELAGEILEEVRSMAYSMHPHVLDDLGLEAALQWLARLTEEHSALTIDVTVHREAAAAPMSREVASALYRVAQESVRNAERHAGAAKVHMTLVQDEYFVSLDVADDGRGFDYLEAASRRPGMGLFAMRERLTLLDGSLELDTAPGRGTRVHASVPVAPGPADTVSLTLPTDVH